MASIELKIIIYALIFMLFFNILLSFIAGAGGISLLDKDTYIQEITADMGIIGGWLTANLLTIGSAMFTFLGIDLISNLQVFPLWLNSIMLAYSILVIFATVFYIVDRLWLG